MVSHGPCSMRLFLVVTLIASLMASLFCGAVRASDFSLGKSLRTRPAAFSPIGTVFSLNSLIIDGRRTSGEQTLWGGELLSVEGTSATADLSDVGQVVFCKRSSARLLPIVRDSSGRGEAILTAVVMAGSVVISLRSSSVACVEIGESIIRSSRGSKFKVGIEGDKTVVEVERGEINKELQQPRLRYIVRSVKINDLGVVIGDGPNVYRMRTKEFRTIPVKVEVRPQPTSRPQQQLEARSARVAYQIGAARQPAIGIQVTFCLTNPTIGSLAPAGGQCTTEITDQQGVAKAQFQASDNEGDSKIRATVAPSSEDYWEGTIEVYKLGFWRLRNVLILAAAAAGGTTICILKCGPPGPLRQEPPPVIP